MVPCLAAGRHRPLALVVEETLQRSRRAVERHGQILAEHGHRGVDRRNTAQDVGHQVTALEARGVPPMRRFVVGRAVDLVEDRARQAPLRQSPEIMEVVTVA
jgi:hypothetical protein